ncbi:hypothetical protein MTR_1g076760 [Medicago truncatula]|uniref:Uncharacterized protein n=1 Tax=Medicago truncatula TaxID=3880 RepID=A0A072VLD8_MEDTR|nr:hypothetical protein MTR_1g076760 [Medicago truncatula]
MDLRCVSTVKSYAANLVLKKRRWRSKFWNQFAKTLDQNATKLVHNWQLVTSIIDANIAINYVILLRVNSSKKCK